MRQPYIPLSRVSSRISRLLFFHLSLLLLPRVVVAQSAPDVLYTVIHEDVDGHSPLTGSFNHPKTWSSEISGELSGGDGGTFTMTSNVDSASYTYSTHHCHKISVYVRGGPTVTVKQERTANLSINASGTEPARVGAAGFSLVKPFGSGGQVSLSDSANSQYFGNLSCSVTGENDGCKVFSAYPGVSYCIPEGFKELLFCAHSSNDEDNFWDEVSSSASGTVTFTVTRGASAPTAQMSDPKVGGVTVTNPSIGQTIQVNNLSYDSDNGNGSIAGEGICSAVWKLTAPNGTVTNGSALGYFTFVPGMSGKYLLELTVTDNEGDTSQTSKTIEVDPREPMPGNDCGTAGSSFECCAMPVSDETPGTQGALNPSTGNFRWWWEDPVSTRGYPLVNNIHINSQTRFPSRLTNLGNASFTYGIEVTIGTVDGVNHWFVIDADGQELDFGPASSAPSATAGIFSTLAEITGGYQLSGADEPEFIDDAGNFTYLFDTNGKLTTVIDPSGNEQEVAYNSNGDIESVTDISTSREITYEYDSPGKAERIVEGSGAAVTHLTYTGDRLTGIVLKDSTNATIRSASLSYNTDGLLSQIVKDGDATSAINITYESAGNGVSVANFSRYSGGGSNFNYWVAPGSGAKYRVTRTNAQGGVEKYDIFANGKLKKIELPAFNGSTWAPVREYTYNANGQLTSATNLATTFSYGYNSLGLMTSRSVSGGQSATYTYNGTDLLTASDQLGTYLTLGYSDSNNPHSATSAEDAGGNEWTFTYNSHGQLLTVSPPTGSPLGTTTYTYEESTSSSDYGYLRSIENGAGDEISFDSYTLLGDPTAISTYPSTSHTDTVALVFDADRRLEEFTHADSKSVVYTYNGHFLSSELDEAANLTSYEYFTDSSGLKSASYPLNKELAVTQTNDLQLASFVDARSKSTTYSYGAGGELKKETHPDGSYFEYLYDSFGRLEKRVDSSARELDYDYDTAGRLMRINFANPGQYQSSYTYLADNRLNTTADEAGNASYYYDSSRRLSKVVYVFLRSGKSGSQSLEYTYNPDDTIATMVWKNGSTTVISWSYTYDAAGRMTSVSNSFGESAEYTYDGEGKIVLQENGNGTTIEYDYNEARNWLTGITHKAGSTVFASYDIEYDNGQNTVGNITEVTELSGDVMSYEYDDLYRLTEESRSGSNSYTTSYTYDLAGNITEINGSSWAGYDDSNKFSSISGGSAGYNPIGCLNAISGTGLQQAAYWWGTRLEMRTQFNGTSSSSDKTEYLYDAFMRRAYRKADNDNNQRAWYIFNGTQLVGEVSPTGPTLAYTWGPDGLVSRTWTGNGTTRYYHFGPQGETRQLTDASGNVVDTYRYDAYGKTLAVTGATLNPHRYGGKFGYYTDEPTDVILATWRWYSPQLRRWLNRDPISYDGGDNLYAYVRGNPVRYVDPDGLDPTAAAAAAAAASNPGAVAACFLNPVCGGVTIGVACYYSPGCKQAFLDPVGRAVADGFDTIVTWCAKDSSPNEKHGRGPEWKKAQEEKWDKWKADEIRKIPPGPSGNRRRKEIREKRLDRQRWIERKASGEHHGQRGKGIR